MKLSTTTIKFLICVGILVILFGIVLFCEHISPETGIVIYKDIIMSRNSLTYTVIIKTEKIPFPVSIVVSENYYNELSINDIYNKSENSKMFSYWLGK